MKGLVRGLVISSLLLFGAATASPAAADKPPTTSGAPLYLALGDSWAAGFGADDPSVGGYVPQLHQALQQAPYDCLPTAEELAADRCKQLQLRNLAVGGATIATMVRDQYPQAIDLLEERNRNLNPRDDVELVTLHISGNDLGVVLGCGANFICIAAQLNSIGERLDAALLELRNEAGPNATIVIGTYDNPYRNQLASPDFCPLGGDLAAIFLANVVLEADPPVFPVTAGLHDLIRQSAERYNIEVAEVFGQLDEAADWHDCFPGHPTDLGYDKVTDVFEGVLGVGQSG